MFLKIIKAIAVVLMFIGVLSLGGYTISEFSTTTEIKNPESVFSSLTETLPDVNIPNVDIPTDSTNTQNTTNSNDDEFAFNFNGTNSNNPSNSTTDNANTNISLPDFNDMPTEIEPKEIDLSKYDLKEIREIELSNKRTIKVTINGNSMELSSETTISFLKWISNNYKNNANINYEETTPPEILAEIEQALNEDESTDTVIVEIDYKDLLESEEDLDILINDIEIVKKLEDIEGYDRQSYEKPSRSYKLGEKKFNRNDYSWKISSFLVSEEPFEYICPYTGQTITDDSKLDYDHIVPLKSTYIRGANEWTDEQKNEYSYDQYIGIDVLNSANRSKSDKGPAEWLPEQNIEDYCYTWLLICSKYDLIMTEDEIDICQDYIQTALDNGDTIERLGGTMPENN